MAIIRFRSVEQTLGSYRLMQIFWASIWLIVRLFHSHFAFDFIHLLFVFCDRDRGIDWLYMYGKSIIFYVIFCLIDSQWIISFECHFVSHASNLIMFSLSFGCQAHCNFRLCLCARSLAHSLTRARSVAVHFVFFSLIHLFHTPFSYNRSVSLSKQTNYRVYCHCITSN